MRHTARLCKRVPEPRLAGSHTRSGTRSEFVEPSLWRHKLDATSVRHSGTPLLSFFTLAAYGRIFHCKWNRNSSTKERGAGRRAQSAVLHLSQVPAWTSTVDDFLRLCMCMHAPGGTGGVVGAVAVSLDPLRQEIRREQGTAAAFGTTGRGARQGARLPPVVVHQLVENIFDSCWSLSMNVRVPSIMGKKVKAPRKLFKPAEYSRVPRGSEPFFFAGWSVHERRQHDDSKHVTPIPVSVLPPARLTGSRGARRSRLLVIEWRRSRHSSAPTVKHAWKDSRRTGAQPGDASGSFMDPIRNYRKLELTIRSQLI